MELTTVLLIVAVVVLLALVGGAVYLILQKRSIEATAVERADELIAASLAEIGIEATVTDLRSDDSELELREAA
jgi:flagellar basal body-associated protein FliL